MTAWLVDGNNVIGSRPDGWWRDRGAAMQRLVTQLDAFAERTGDDVHVVFDGHDRDLDASRVAVAFAPHADDAIAGEARAGVTVVTSDRELARRAAERGAQVEPSGRFRGLLERGGGGAS